MKSLYLITTADRTLLTDMPLAKDTTQERNYQQTECLPKHKLDCPYQDWVAPTLPKNPILALCETEQDVHYFSQPTSAKIDKIIALTPQAAAHCILTDTPYLKIEDFFDVKAFWYGDEPMLALQSHWAESLDAYLADVYQPFRAVGFQSAGAVFFFLKVVIDMLFRSAFGLSHLLITRPKKLYYFPNQVTDDTIDETLFFKDSLYRQLLPLFAATYDVSIEPLCLLTKKRRIWGSLNAAHQNTLKSLLISWLPPKLIRQLRQAKEFDFTELFKANHYENGPILLYQSGYDVSITAKYAHKMGFHIQSLKEILPTELKYSGEMSDITLSLAKAWEQICQSPFFREPFYWCGVDMFSVAESRLRYWWHTLTPQLWGMFSQACGRFEKTRPDIVVVYSPWNLQHHAVLQAARMLSIPTVTYQHGGFEGNCEYTTYDMTDMHQSDYRLVYGEGNAAYFQERKSYSNKQLAKIIPVGSSRLDALRATLEMGKDRSRMRRQLQITDSDILISYLPTSYQYNWYMSREAYLGVPYLELLFQVVNVFRAFPQLQFIYKSFPENPLDPMSKIIATCCPNCQFVSDIPMTLLLQASDAFILDMPSTALLETLLTDKPILMFSDKRFIALRPEARTLLRKRVILTETPNDFMQQLRLFLSQGKFEKLEYADREFLRAYGTFNDDGNSAWRAVAALNEIMEVSSKK